MTARILLLQGHPDPAGGHFGHALADAYAEGATEAGHELRRIELATLDFPLLRSKADWETGELPAALVPAREAVQWAQHIVLFFPLWLGGMPALTRGFLEQLMRPGFALGRTAEVGANAGARAGADAEARPSFPAKLLQGRSARVVVTMGMPALVYRWYFRAHSLKALERNILGFVGIAPVRETLIGMVEGKSDVQRRRCVQQMIVLGRKGA